MAERVSSAPPDLNSPRRIHIVGVAGAGMSAIATVLAQMGNEVTGSDLSDSPVLTRLEKQGIGVHVGHVPAAAAEADLVAVSSAIPSDDPEVLEARGRGVEVVSRAAVLAAICRQRRTVAISGTHGKTTTSSMLAVILKEASWRPSMIIGGDINRIGAGSAWDPEGEWMVVEADESDGTFLELGAEAVAVTSIASDHLDHYGTRAELDRAFETFLSDPTGPAFICLDDPGSALVAPHVDNARTRLGRPPLITYGSAGQADVRVEDIELARTSSSFRLVASGSVYEVHLDVPGEHNVLNATAAVSLATAIGVPWPDAISGIGAYRGVGRRFETRGEAGGVAFIDDYAHNPEKVAAALATARSGGWSRVVAVFQPHRYSRTEALWREFGPALGGADVLIVTGIYSAGEPARSGVSGSLIADAVRESKPDVDVRYVETLDEAEAELRSVLRPGDVCLTMGAGDVTSLASRFLGGTGARGAGLRGDGARGDGPGDAPKRGAADAPEAAEETADG